MRRLLAGAAVAAALTAAPVFADPVSAQDVEDDDDDGGDAGLWGLLGLLGLAGLAGLRRRPVDRHTFPTTYPTTGGAPPASSPNPPRP
jgi:MYXO-CTERM domain-containing protein